jgi:hypothetical protein
MSMGKSKKKLPSNSKLHQERHGYQKKIAEQSREILQLRSRVQSAEEGAEKLKEASMQWAKENGRKIAVGQVAAILATNAKPIIEAAMDSEDPVAWRLEASRFLRYYDHISKDVKEDYAEVLDK